jgi:hypothetical protein
MHGTLDAIVEGHMSSRGARPFVLVAAIAVGAWSNGQSGNAGTDTAAECSNPPYATHDWIAEHALDLLPDAEKAWLTPHRAIYLIGTEAPDNDHIAAACGTPNHGYDDRSQGHSITWDTAWTSMTVTRAAVRAREEYQKAVAAFQGGNPRAAAFYMGAMAHYIGDVSQYGHSVPWESKTLHGDYESWAARRTATFAAGHFESAVALDNLVNRTPYTAVKRISRATGRGQGVILSAREMEDLQDHRDDPQFLASVGASLNLAVNELADVLHTFYLNVVAEPDTP